MFGLFVAAIAGGWVIHQFDNTSSANAADPTASPSASATVAATQTPAPGAQAPSSSGVCVLSVIGPWSHFTEATGAYDIEVGGGDPQHFDFHPRNGVPAVSYLVPPLPRGGVAAKWKGFGQMWQGNPRECAKWPWVKDATDYATGSAIQPGRMQNGHSGLVMDLMGAKPQIVANAVCMTKAQVTDLLQIHAAGMSNPFDVAAVVATMKEPCTPLVAVTGSAPAGSTCTTKEGTRSDHSPVKGEAWNVGPTDTYRVANVWSNHSNPNTGEYKILLKPGESASLISGGGSVWSYPANCGDVAQAAYASNPKSAITLAAYQAYVDNGTMP